MRTTEKAQLALNKLVDLFSSQELARQVSFTFIQTAGRPSDNWSFGNQILQMLAGTTDGRTYLAWQQAGRQVKKGSTAFYILQPIMIQVKEADKTGKEQKRPVLVGFKAAPRFRIEDTEITNPELWQKVSAEYKPKQLPPLMQVAEHWKIKVEFAQSQAGEKGSFNPAANVITLSVEENAKTFFHELAHAGQLKIDGQLKNGQDAEQEIIAELTAAVLSEMYGYDTKDYSYQYIKAYSQSKTPDQVGRACLKVLEKVRKILNLILETEEKITEPDQAIETETAEPSATAQAVAIEPVISQPEQPAIAEKMPEEKKTPEAEIVILADTRGQPDTAELSNFGINSEQYHSRPARKEDTEIKPGNLNSYLEASRVKPLTEFFS